MNGLSAFHWTNLLILPGLLAGFTVHELAHAFVAYFLGDYSRVEQGQISLNPIRHISWFGLVAFLLFGVGWPKPLRANAHALKKGYLGLFLVAIAGPLASLTLALVGLMLTLVMAAILVYAGGVTTDEVFGLLIPGFGTLPETLDLQALAMALTSYVFTASFWLTFTSLLPLPGLDGFVALTSLVLLFRQRRMAANLSRPQPIRANTPWILLAQHQRRNNAADIHFKFGAEYHEANQYEDAIARYRQAIASDRSFGPAYVNMGLAYLAQGRRKEAIQAFRGAIEYADDKKSQAEAWQQLHLLSEVSPVDQTTAQESMAKMGATPWTDTKPQPNWLKLAIAAGLILLLAMFLYGYVLTALITLLQGSA